MGIVIGILAAVVVAVAGYIAYRRLSGGGDHTGVIADFEVIPDVVCNTATCAVSVRFTPQELGDTQVVALHLPIGDDEGNPVEVLAREPFEDSFDPTTFDLSVAPDQYRFSAVVFPAREGLTIDGPSRPTRNQVAEHTVQRLDSSAPLAVDLALGAAPGDPDPTRREGLHLFGASAEELGALGLDAGATKLHQFLSLCKGMRLLKVVFERYEVRTPLGAPVTDSGIVGRLRSTPLLLTLRSPARELTQAVNVDVSMDLGEMLFDEGLELRAVLDLPADLQPWPDDLRLSARLQLGIACPD